MNKIQRECLNEYLKDTDIDIYCLNFLKGGNISSDTLSISYYMKNMTDGDWYMFTDMIDPSGNVATNRGTKVVR